MSVCEHHFLYFGVVNLAYRDRIVGAIDVWRCDKCYAVDVLPKRLGSLEQANPLGFNAVEPSSGKWVLLTCLMDDGFKFDLLPLQTGQMVHHDCLEGTITDWKVEDDYSLKTKERAALRTHNSYLIERFVGHTIELTAEHPLIYGTVLIAYCAYEPFLQRLALEIRGRLRSFTGVALTGIEAKDKWNSFLNPLYVLLPHYTAKIKPAITDLSRYDFVVLCFARKAQAFSLMNSYVRLLSHVKGKSFAPVLYGKEFKTDRRIDCLLDTLRAIGGEIVSVSTITSKPHMFQALKEQIDDLSLRLRSILATSV